MDIKGKLRSSFQKCWKWFNKEHIYYRLFWGVVIIISAWNIIWIFLLTLTRFFSDSISIGIETTYLRWNNTFPAVSFCLTKNRSSSRVMEFVKTENITHKVSATNYVKNLHDYMFTNPNHIHFKEDYCDGLNSTCGVDILRVRKELLPKSCEDFMTNISFRGMLYENCTDIFTFHELEMGYCYLSNNLIDYESFNNLPLKFDISHTDKSMKIYLRGGFLWKYEMYVHSPEDLPYFNSITYDSFSDPTVYRFNVEEYDNNPDVKHESIKQRSCKFPDERDPGSPWHYSFSNCMSYLRIQFELEKCNCTHYTSPKIYKPQYCDIKGLKCIEEAQISTQTKEYVVKNNACYPSCLEQQVTLVGSNEIGNMEIPNMFYVEVSITNLPTVRYNRVVTQTYLDLVVSVGGVIGLFAGASALNIFEIFYVILRRN
ncbi:Pickpocket protein 19 [Lucilia cuprina]|nr:Pickpocket protein 19 [Lucilia cuprina]